MTYVGQRMKRFEDPRLLKGGGSYVDDMTLPGMLHAVVLRSPHAHARILSIDSSAAMDLPGVLAVHTWEDLEGVVGTIPPRVRADLKGAKVPEHPVLAKGKVCYVGQPVAVLVAEDRYVAKDGLDLIHVEYEILQPVMDPLQAADDSPVIIHDDIGSNVAVRHWVGRGDMKEAIAQADRVVRGTYDVPRLSPAPLEGRGLIALYQPEEQLLTLWSSTQAPHKVKRFLAIVLNRENLNVRVVAPDVGGGFGQKVELWPEDVAMSYMAIVLERPIKWVEDRWENMLAYHGRGHSGEVEAAVKNDGSILGMRARIVADVGAYFLTSTQGPPLNAAHRFNGPYAIPTMDVECLVVNTNKPSTGPYRGAGGPEGAMFMERTVDLIAKELDLDPVDVRRKNLIAPDAFPYATGTGLTYDSGNYEPVLDRALELGEYSSFRLAQQQRGSQEPLMGIGVSTVCKASGGQGEMMTSSARVRVEPSGQVKVSTEVSPHGQGTATTFAQIVADELGIRPEDVELLHGDTDLLPTGQGTFASRGLAVGGSAMYEGVQEVRKKISVIAGRILDCSPEDIILQDGKVFSGADPEKAMSFSEVATAAQNPESNPPGTEPGLDFLVSFSLPNNPYSFATHVVVVEIDQDTGELKILRYAAVHDCGTIINPKLLDAQVHGAIAQGLGQALSEGISYDSDGQPLAGTFMDYAVPFMEDMPLIALDNKVTPSPTNPMGVKGIGELPTVASPVALSNAILDALYAAGVRHIDTPLTSEKIWQALQGTRR